MGISSKELRIGNWVNYENEPLEFILDDFMNIEFGELSESYEPIPLTEEWLLKFGFKKDGGFNWIIVGHRIYVPTTNIFVCDKNGVVLKHVHQLQNLYFALTNKELTIKQ